MYLPACEVCNALNTSASVVRIDCEFGPSRLIPFPMSISLPSLLSHCRTGLVDNPLTASETKQRSLRLWPKMGADTALAVIINAVFGTVKEVTINISSLHVSYMYHIG